MFLPVILDFENNGLKFQLLKYLRFLDVCIEKQWPLITHEEFEKYELNFPNRNEYTINMQNTYAYNLHDREERSSIRQYFVPAEYYAKLEQSKGSKLESMLYLLSSRDSEFETILEGFINDLYSNDIEIEGILYFAACPLSLKVVAEKLHIPMIAYETGPIRKNNYRCNTSYFCRDGLYNTNEIAERYQIFKNQIDDNGDISIFSRREILALFLSQENLKYLSLIDKTPRYELGVAGGCSIVVPYFAINKYMDHELIDDALEQYKPHEILFRLHPGDMYKSTYRLHHYDITPHPFAFLLDCKRVAAVGSNLLLEAMLWERVACSKTEVMPATFMCRKNYTDIDNLDDVELFVNFYIFSFLIPFERAFDEDYMRWRLTDPPEIDIYNNNLMFYLEQFGLNESWLKLETKQRLNVLKLFRNYEVINEKELKQELCFAYPNTIVNAPSTVKVENVSALTNSSDGMQELETRYNQTKEHLDAVLNSTTWKMTAPLRNIIWFLKGGYSGKKNNSGNADKNE